MGLMKNHVKRSSSPRKRPFKGFSPRRKESDAEQVLQVAIKLYKQFARDGFISDLDYKYLVHRSTHEGLSFLTETLPTLGKAFDKALGGSKLVTPTSFARKRKAGATLAYPGSFLVQHFRRVFHPSGSLLPNPNVDSVRIIRQICYYAYKADVPNRPSKDAKVVDGFVECENQLAAFILDATSKGGVFDCDESGPLDPILRFGANAISSVFDGFDINSLRPRHGPGATSDVSIPRKWRERPRFVNAFTHDSSDSDSELLELAGSYRWFNSNHLFDDPTAIKPWDPFEGWLKPLLLRRAKVLLVPKDSRGPRLISAEPAYAQFIQQGIQSWMYNKAESHPYTSGHVNFTDQSINRRLAIEGSESGDWSTLDLKEASDRVSMALVICLFSGCPALLTALNAVRSSYTVLPDGREISLLKHAPMGSATCFPVMSSCIWAILLSGFIACGVSYEEALGSIYVYGDDIIVPSSLHDVSIRLLEHYGLLVNKSKSFRGKGFLESCGADAFLGHDVTPVRLRSIYGLVQAKDATRDKRVATPRQRAAVCFVAHGNELRSKGYFSASDYSFAVASSILGTLPCVPRGCGILGVESDIPHHWTTEDGYLRGFRVKSVSTNFPLSPWDHFRRIEATIGNEVVLAFGDYDLPRCWKLKKVAIPSYLLPVGEYPKWLPKGNLL